MISPCPLFDQKWLDEIPHREDTGKESFSLAGQN